MTIQEKNLIVNWAPVIAIVILLSTSYGVLYSQVQRQADKLIGLDLINKDQDRLIDQYRKVQLEIRETQIRSEERQIRIEDRLIRIEEQQRQIFNKTLYLKKDSFSRSSAIVTGGN